MSQEKTEEYLDLHRTLAISEASYSCSIEARNSAAESLFEQVIEICASVDVNHIRGVALKPGEISLTFGLSSGSASLFYSTNSGFELERDETGKKKLPIVFDPTLKAFVGEERDMLVQLAAGAYPPRKSALRVVFEAALLKAILKEKLM